MKTIPELFRPFRRSSVVPRAEGALRVLLTATVLLAPGCGDDEAGDDTASSSDDDALVGDDDTSLLPASPTPRPAPNSPEPDGEVDPSPEPVDQPSNDVDDDVTADDDVGDVSDTGPMPPGDGPPGDMPDADCGGEGQACCDMNQCRPGFACVLGAADVDAGAVDAGVESGGLCERGDDAPPVPAGDAGAPMGPPDMMPPAPEGDAGAPLGPPDMMPPAPRGDAGPGGPPGMMPMEDCGGETEICCAGPNGCDEGLTCENPGGPERDDSECVPE